MTNEPRSRHLTTAALLEHWDTGVPVLIPLAGDPPLQMRIDRSQERLTLRAPLPANTELPTNPLTHVQLALVVEGAERMIEISTTDERLVTDGYAMLSAVADRIQLEATPPLAALDSTLATWRSILATRVRMSTRAEVGLMGELLVLRALLRQDASLKLSCWRGGQGEEHDFGFNDADLEVKTTSGERRQHWIHGLGQLVPTEPTPLWMVSVQITRAGADKGQMLGQLVDEVLDIADPGERETLRKGLASAGWRPEDSDLFGEPWGLRSVPAVFHIDDSFPRLTAEQLSSAGVEIAAIRQVSYEIDLTGRPSSMPIPSILERAVTQMKGDL